MPRKPLKKIGLLIPATNSAAEPELARHLPANASVHTARMLNANGEDAMIDTYLPEAVRDLAMVKPDVVVFACTTAGASRGAAFERQLIQSIADTTGAPTVSVMNASSRALKELGAKAVGVITPYPKAANDHIEHALEEAGFNVVAIDGLQMPGINQSEFTANDLIEFGHQVLAGKDVDAVFISCTNLFTLDDVDTFRQAFGRPVVTSLSAALDEVNGLIAEPAAQPA